MLGETAHGEVEFSKVKHLLVKKTGEIPENRIPGFLRKDSRPNSRDLIYVS